MFSWDVYLHNYCWTFGIYEKLKISFSFNFLDCLKAPFVETFDYKKVHHKVYTSENLIDSIW